MRMPSPQRVVIVVASYLRRFFISLSNWLLICGHPRVFVGVIERARVVIAPRENRLIFFLHILFFQWRMHSRRCRNNLKTPQYRFVGRDHYEAAIKSGRPVIVVLWHHGIHPLDQFMQELHPEAIASTSSELSRPNTIVVDGGQSLLSLIKIRYLLDEQKKILIWSFDGPAGSHCMPVNLLGSQLLLSRGYPALVKMINPVVIPFTDYLGIDVRPQFYWGAPLFDEPEVFQLTEQQILEKTVSYFSHDLIANGPYHLDWHELFQRYCRDAGIITSAQ